MKPIRIMPMNRKMPIRPMTTKVDTAAARAAATNPAGLLGATDRGSLEEGRQAHVVELDDELGVRRVTRGEGWIEA